MRDAGRLSRGACGQSAPHRCAGLPWPARPQAGHSDAAIDLLLKAIASDRRNPEPHYNLARILSDRGRDDEAIVHNRKVLEVDPNFPGAHNNLAALLLLHGRPAEALAAAVQGLLRDDAAGLKTTFVMALRQLDLAAIKRDPNLVQLLVRALREPWSRPRDLSAAAGAILLRSQAMARCVEHQSREGVMRLADMFSATDLDALGSDGLFDALLTSAPVTTIAIERVLTAIRRAALNEIASGEFENSGAWLPLITSIGQQGFINEYIFDVSESEKAQLENLRADVADAATRNETIAPLKLAILASYLPLHSLSGAETLAAQPWPGELAALLKQQITDPRGENQIRASIERLTAIEDDVSEKVRAQYEENPYPRWSRIPAETQALPVDAYIGMRFPGAPYKPLGHRAPDILVAGCGTGQHAIQRAQQFQSANVLAIDLSLASLSYAMANERAGADQPALCARRYSRARSDRTFDIDSSGVLHHLKEPLTGWRGLANLLRPGGRCISGFGAAARQEMLHAVISRSRAGIIRYRRCAGCVPRSRAARRAISCITLQLQRLLQQANAATCCFMFRNISSRFRRSQIFCARAGLHSRLRDPGAQQPAALSDDRAATNLANWAIFEAEIRRPSRRCISSGFRALERG